MRMLHRLRVNVLCGTPSSIISFAKTAERLDLRFGIEKVIFTGEKFSWPRRAYVHDSWPGLQIFGLYGQSEIGFLGLNGPGCAPDNYHLMDDSLLFLECDPEQGLLVTSLDESDLVPILRYAVGDQVLLHPACPCGHSGTSIQVLSRCNDTFKYSGNLISAKTLIDTLVKAGAVASGEVQILLRNTPDLKDQLLVNVHTLNDQEVDTRKIKDLLCGLPDIREAISKKTGEVQVQVVPYAALDLSRSQKTKILCDLRT